MKNRNSLIFDFEELDVQCIKEIWPTFKIEADGIKISCRKDILWKKDIIAYSESLCQKWYGKTNVLFGQSSATGYGGSSVSPQATDSSTRLPQPNTFLHSSKQTKKQTNCFHYLIKQT